MGRDDVGIIEMPINYDIPNISTYFVKIPSSLQMSNRLDLYE